MTLVSAFALLLSRFANMRDVAIGTPIAGRNRVELESLIGLFVNSLVLRLLPDEQENFETQVARAARVCLAAYAHQDVPFDQVVEAVQPERALNHAALAQVMFSFKNTPDAATGGMPGMKIRGIDTPHVTAKMDISLDLQEIDGGIGGMIEYNTDLFDEATIRNLAARFRGLLAALAETPDRPTRAIPLTIPEETKQLLDRWNQTERPLPEQSPIDLFRATAARQGAATAVEEGVRETDYHELSARVDRLAGSMRENGVVRGSVVALWLEPGLDSVTAMLACARLGAIYLPLDTEWPEARIGFVLKDARVALVLSSVSPAHAIGIPILNPSEGSEATVPEIPVSPEEPTYLMYTSGSTGNPKGVLIPGKGIVRLVIDNDFFRFTAEDRVAQVANPAFDVTTREVWGALLNGATLVIFPRALLLRPDEMATWIEEKAITIMSTATALFNQLMMERADLFSRIRSFSMGGEAVDPRAVRNCLEAGPPTRLINAYGPTENTANSSWYLIEALPEQAPSVPIGTPLNNSTCYVVDQSGNPSPPGFPGELWVGGPGLAIGYHGRPARTAEVFVPNPFGDEPGDRLYRTGDEVRLIGDTAPVLVFMGRLDAQVKLRGFRIELGEIEQALVALEGVAAAAVLLREDLPAGTGLVAYVEGEDRDDLKTALAQRLPAYMIPTAIVTLATLPRTSGGKPDRKALARRPLPAELLGEDPAEFVAPASDSEEKVATAWRETLNLERVGIHANFFELGGHSLLLVKLQRRLREAFAQDVALVDLIANPTVATQATLLAPQPTIAPVKEEVDHGARRRSAAKSKRDKWKKRRGG